MARHNFRCVCGALAFEVNIPISLGARAGAPICDCGRPMEPIPGIGRMDVGGVKGVAFQAFDTRDGLNRPVRIDSFHTMARVERESEKMAADGVGQRVIWRRHHQDASNRDVHTLGTVPGEAPDPAFLRRSGKAIRSAVAPDVTYGPGVSDANTSALGDAPTRVVGA